MPPTCPSPSACQTICCPELMSTSLRGGAPDGTRAGVPWLTMAMAIGFTFGFLATGVALMVSLNATPMPQNTAALYTAVPKPAPALRMQSWTLAAVPQTSPQGYHHRVVDHNAKGRGIPHAVMGNGVPLYAEDQAAIRGHEAWQVPPAFALFSSNDEDWPVIAGWRMWSGQGQGQGEWGGIAISWHICV